MKSKFGFIPIVLPVLVMVLIIGLINIGNAPWVQAHEPSPDDPTPPSTHGAPEHTHNIPTNHPRVSALDVVDRNAAGQDTDGTVTLTPTFHTNVSRYKASATYDVKYIGVTHTVVSPATVDVKVMKPGDSKVYTLASQTATTSLPLGKTTIVVTATDPANNNSGETRYVIELTREMPQFNRLTLHNAVGPAVSLDHSNPTLGADPNQTDILKGSNTLMGNDPDLRGNTATDVKVQYHIDKIGLELDVAAGLRNGNNTPAGWGVAVTFNTRGINVTTTTETPATFEVRSHPLNVGKNEIRIQVRSTSTRSHLTDYRIVIERAKPQMETAHYKLGSADSPAPVLGFGLDTTSISTSVATYTETTTSVTAHGPGSPGMEGAVEFRYARKAGEGRNDFDDPDTEAYDGMRLVPGDNTLYITAYDRENPANGSTKYTLTIVRGKTPLGGVTLTSSSTNSAVDNMGAPLYWDAMTASPETRRSTGASVEVHQITWSRIRASRSNASRRPRSVLNSS